MAEIKNIQQLLEQNQARLKSLRESFRSQLSALVKEDAGAIQLIQRIERELDALDTQILEHKNIISNQQEQLSQIREAGAAVEARIGSLYTELSEQQKEITVLEATLKGTEGRIKIVEQELVERKNRLEALQTRLEGAQQDLGKQKEAQAQKLQQKKDALTNAKTKYTQVKEANPVAAYLMTEGLEPPELDIIALLIHKKKVPLPELKRVVKVPPAIATRVLKELENKGIIEITSSDEARLVVEL